MRAAPSDSGGQRLVRFAVDRLRDQQVQQRFNDLVSNRFALLADGAPGAASASTAAGAPGAVEGEWRQLQAAVTAAALDAVGELQPGHRRHHITLPEATASMLLKKEAAHATIVQKHQDLEQLQRAAGAVGLDGVERGRLRRQARVAAGQADRARQMHRQLAQAITRRVRWHDSGRWQPQQQKRRRCGTPAAWLPSTAWCAGCLSLRASPWAQAASARPMASGWFSA
jgi:hypothetical protein